MFAHKHITTKHLSILAFLLSLFLAALPVLAQNTVTLEIPIPGIGDTITVCSGGRCTGIALYIISLTKWAIGAIILLAVTVLMYGGFVWLTAAGSQKRLGEAQKHIFNSLTGLGIALFSTLFLWTISPSLVKFNAPDVASISEIIVEIEHRDDPTPASSAPGYGGGGGGSSGGGCVTATPAEILGLINSGKIMAPPKIRDQIERGSGGRTIDNRTLGAVKTIYETCGGGFGISSGIRSGGSGNHAGFAVDIVGNICGKPNGPGVRDDPEDYCNHPGFKSVVQKLVGMKYRVGAWRGRCGTFMECPSCTGATGVHMHIDVNHGACR